MSNSNLTGVKCIGAVKSKTNPDKWEVASFVEASAMISESGAVAVFPKNSKTRNRPYAVGTSPVGTFFLNGRFQEFETTDYEIDGKIINKTTIVVLEGEDGEALANSSLKRNGAKTKRQDAIDRAEAEKERLRKEAADKKNAGVGA